MNDNTYYIELYRIMNGTTFTTNNAYITYCKRRIHIPHDIILHYEVGGL